MQLHTYNALRYVDMNRQDVAKYFIEKLLAKQK